MPLRRRLLTHQPAGWSRLLIQYGAP